ncbi:hypothetical protein [Mycobacterium sp.]|uniref:hypothetical protein n=1 Tax=Mycobacterium sp. TaxID=1785 RepID=UPI002C1D2A9D|nr:hypothetical protein [Mycobacterium sp.]HME49552.1 hypothetical protein [Mycobacterium sp.]
MQLRPGLRLNSRVSSAQVIVVRTPAEDVDIRCGGQPMVTGDAAPAVDASVDGEMLLIGKRYCDTSGALEVLCTKAGPGGLTVGEEVLEIKAAKPLPASD